MDRYEREGAKAFKHNQTRESCRYKKADCREKWMLGYDKEAEADARHKAAAKVVRWEPRGGNGWANPPRPPEAYYLRGEAPGISVHGDRYEPRRWFVSCHQWAIEDVRLEATDPEEAKREALVVVMNIARKRLAKMTSIATADGRLLVEPTDDENDESEVEP